MPADVTSISALRDWIAALARYQADASESLAGVELELRRAQDWLHDQYQQWRQAVRHCEEEVVQAKAVLASKRFPNWDGKLPDTTVEERNLRRAEARLDFARERVQSCQRWQTQMPRLVDELYSGAARRLQHTLEGDVPRVLAALDKQTTALEEYARLRPDFAPTPREGVP
jgi:hypothetical protein